MVELSDIVTDQGYDLDELSRRNPVFLGFLRHFGCGFCREALHDISKEMDYFDSKGIFVVMVHMAESSTALNYFEQFNLKGIQHVSDPECFLYARFGLAKGSFSQLFGLRTWIRGYEANKNGIPYQLQPVGDSIQMPGIFMLCEGQVKGSFIHRSISDKPDYKKLTECCV